jgi:hypothetical protein
MSIEDLAGFIMHLFKNENAEPGYTMMYGKISVQVSTVDQPLLPKAINLLNVRGHITLTRHNTRIENDFLVLTQEGYESIKRSRDL